MIRISHSQLLQFLKVCEGPKPKGWMVIEEIEREKERQQIDKDKLTVAV